MTVRRTRSAITSAHARRSGRSWSTPGSGTQTFDIVATKNGRRLEVTTARGVVEVSEVTRGGTPVRTGRFMASRLIALVEHPAQEQPDSRVEVQTRRRLRPGG